MDREQSINELRLIFAQRRLVDAKNFCMNLTQEFPKDIEIWRMRANLHFQLNEIDQLAVCSQKILQLSNTVPLTNDLILALDALGRILRKTDFLAETIDIRKRLLPFVPNETATHFDIGCCYLALGDFEQGWPEFEWRLKLGLNQISKSKKPCWDGSPFKEKTLLITTEGGHGDTIQFIRYLPHIKDLGGTIILDVWNQPKIFSLLRNTNLADVVIIDGKEKMEYDLEATMMSLPFLIKSLFNDIPSRVPYISALSTSETEARKNIARHTDAHCRVGVVWGTEKDPLRSIQLDQFSELFNVAGIKFFSLQKGPLAIPLDILTDLNPHIEDFADTAAAIQELDLVISVDTAVAHLAGALGKPVWTLIPFVPDWRWMLNREDSPWYPTMRLFRQPAPGDWASVIKRVSEELKALVGAK